jgi:hypothetical protein
MLFRQSAFQREAAGVQAAVDQLGGDRVDTDVAWEVEAEIRKHRASFPEGPPAEPESEADPSSGGVPAGTVTVADVTTFDDLAAQMVRAEVVVASRFHNLICALRLGRPSVSIGYAEKNTRLMQELGLDEYCQNIETLDAATLLEQIRRARQEADQLAVRIGAGTRDHDARVRSLLDDVAHRVLGLPRVGTGNPL